MLLAFFPILYSCTAFYLKKVTTQGCLLANLLIISLPKIHVFSLSLGQLISTNLQGPYGYQPCCWLGHPVKIKFISPTQGSIIIWSRVGVWSYLILVKLFFTSQTIYITLATYTLSPDWFSFLFKEFMMFYLEKKVSGFFHRKSSVNKSNFSLTLILQIASKISSLPRSRF